MRACVFVFLGMAGVFGGLGGILEVRAGSCTKVVSTFDSNSVCKGGWIRCIGRVLCIHAACTAQ